MNRNSEIDVIENRKWQWSLPDNCRHSRLMTPVKKEKDLRLFRTTGEIHELVVS